MNFANLAKAAEHYERRGYAYISDAPWYIDKESLYATKPEGAHDLRVSYEDKYLPASGEQSFIQMMLKDKRQLKKAYCITPCFRVESYNEWHKPYFMKLELINADDPSLSNLLMMVHDACAFFEQFVQIKVEELGPNTFDILEKTSRVELGSYGIRKFQNLTWIYGTGCAEPRLSDVQHKVGRWVVLEYAGDRRR